MQRYDYDFGIIGGGAAGLTAASGAAQLGARTLLIEKEDALGGDCLHYGCVPSKTLIKIAHVRHLMQTAERYGLPAVVPGPVDFSAIAGRISSVIARIQEHDSLKRFTDLGVTVRKGAPSFQDEHSASCDGRTISARKWLIATGSSPALPTVPGLDTGTFLTNREIFTLANIPQSLIILGAGPIAIEMAQAFNRLGSKVVVLQRSPQILSREDKDMADDLMHILQEEGIAFHLGCKPVHVRNASGIKEVVLSTADGREFSVCGTHLLVALGRTANIDGLGLDRLGIEASANGIRVDGRLRTARRNIFAAGDVIGGYQFTHAAGYEGSVALSNAVLHLPRKVDYRRMPRCTYTAPELAGIGMNEKAANAAGISYRVWTEDFSANDRGLAEQEGRGRVKLLIGNNGKPLGVQILGPHAGELLAEWVAIFNGGVGLAAIAGAIHPYPTLSEINKKVVGAIYSEKLFSPKVKNALKLLFGYRG